jgi:hypothetical protein
VVGFTGCFAPFFRLAHRLPLPTATWRPRWFAAPYLASPKSMPDNQPGNLENSLAVVAFEQVVVGVRPFATRPGFRSALLGGNKGCYPSLGPCRVDKPATIFDVFVGSRLLSEDVRTK